MESNYTNSLEEWAGSSRLTLALLFTDIVDSTAIGIKLGDEQWIDHLATHFWRGRELADIHRGYVVKVIGDAFMIVFKNSTDAVNFAIDFSLDTGVEFIGIRVGLHSGQVSLMDNDVYGLNVNEAARIQTSIPKEGIRVSDSVKKDFQRFVGVGGEMTLSPIRADLKNFGRSQLWDVSSLQLKRAWRSAKIEREKIIGPKRPTKTGPLTPPNNVSGTKAFGTLPPLIRQNSPIKKTFGELLFPPKSSKG